MRPPHQPASFSPTREFSQYARRQDLFWMDEFYGAIVDTAWWETVDAGGATQAMVSASNGCFELAFTSADESQDAVLFGGDVFSFDIYQRLYVEARVKFTVAPTAGNRAVIGMASATGADKDAIAVAAWFKLSGDMVVLVESDDTSNNNNNVVTGKSLVLDTYAILAVDFRSVDDVKFYLNGQRLAAGTTFDMTNLTAAEALVQPYFSMDKANTAVGTMRIDYFKAWQERANA